MKTQQVNLNQDIEEFIQIKKAFDLNNERKEYEIKNLNEIFDKKQTELL